MTCSLVHLLITVITVFETLVRASYYLDNTNSNITYSGDWLFNIDVVVFDGSKLYNGTFVFAPGGNPEYTIAIPFNGSGITLYSMIVGESWFNVSIDGGAPTNHLIDGVLGCCTPTIPPLYNYTIYRASSLPLGNHTLLLTLLGAFTPRSVANHIFFDYAFVDSPDNPRPTTSTSSDVHSSTTSAINVSTTKPKSRSVIGPAVGGTVGGIILISITVFILFRKRRRTRRGDTKVIDPDPTFLVSNVDRRPIVGASYHSSSTIIDPDPNIAGDSLSIVGTSWHQPSSNGSPSTLHTRPLPNLVDQRPQSQHTSDTSTSRTVPSTLPPPVSTLLPSSDSISKVEDVILTAPGPTSEAPESALASQEARFLRHLYDRNAPAEEIAELMQAMQMRASQGGNADTAGAGIAPPAYGSLVIM